MIYLAPAHSFLFLRDFNFWLTFLSSVSLLSLFLVIKYPYVLLIQTSFALTDLVLHQSLCPWSPFRSCQYQASHLWPPPSVISTAPSISPIQIIFQPYHDLQSNELTTVTLPLYPPLCSLKLCLLKLYVLKFHDSWF